MKLDRHVVHGIHITDRLEEAVEVQKLLTEYGDCIKTRLGMHEVEEGSSAPNGVLICEMVGPDGRIHALAEKLNALEGVEVQTMTFHHPAP